MTQDHDVYQILDILGHLSCHIFSASLQRVLLLTKFFELSASILHNFRIFQAVRLENSDSIIYESISFWLMHKYLRKT